MDDVVGIVIVAVIFTTVVNVRSFHTSFVFWTIWTSLLKND